MQKNQIKIEQTIEYLAQEEKKIPPFIFNKNNLYAIGKNQETVKVSKVFRITGIIDDGALPDAHWNNIPLVKSKDANKNYCVINCSTSIRPVDTLHYLKQAGFTSVINLFELALQTGETCLLPDFVTEQRNEIDQHTSEWQEIFDNLCDQTSRDTFLDTLKFRLTANPKFMEHYKVRLKDQYFENFMQYREEIFVDAGGFDGDTAIEFAKRYPDYKKIIIFEPSKNNMNQAKERLAGFRNIEFFQIGLSNTKTELRFTAEVGSASSINKNGNEKISVATLDSLVQEPITFIKMDLEGWEIPAIQGATEHIKNTTPKLALATYHNAPDLRKIYEHIQNTEKDYEIFLRHYTQGWSETILFFKPRFHHKLQKTSNQLETL